jgi:MSHA biogenesis protein MshG
MAMYEWRGRNNQGEAVNGQLDALTESAVADQLKLIGVVPLHIAAAKVEVQSQSEGWWQRISRKPVVDEDLMIFSRQMYTLNKAGRPHLAGFFWFAGIGQ